LPYNTCNDSTGINAISDYELYLAAYGSVDAGLYTTGRRPIGSVTASVTGVVVLQGYGAVTLRYYHDQGNLDYAISISQPSLVTNKTGLYASFDIQYGRQAYNRTANLF
jgi:hypothetical protein